MVENDKLRQLLNRIPKELHEVIEQSDIIDVRTKSQFKNRFQKNDQKIFSDIAKSEVLAEIKRVK